MRLLHLDRFVVVEPGARVTGLATFGRTGEYLRGHFPASPRVPVSLLLESMAQLVGWALVEAHGFSRLPILCLVDGAEFQNVELAPGFVAELGGEILSTGPSDSLGRAWLEVEGRRIATVRRLIYRHFPALDPEQLRRGFAELLRGG